MEGGERWKAKRREGNIEWLTTGIHTHDAEHSIRLYTPVAHDNIVDEGHDANADDAEEAPRRTKCIEYAVSDPLGIIDLSSAS